jgi:voltage-gated potassium channel
MLPARPGSIWTARLALVMFVLAFVYLLGVAGILHRAGHERSLAVEVVVMHWVLLVMWPLFVTEAALAAVYRSPEVSLRTAVWRVVLVAACPAARMGWVNPVTNQIWLPWWGWRSPGKALLKDLDKVFGGPMLLFAFLILPVLGIEYVKADLVKETPWLGLTLDIGIAVIWVAFAVEFVIKVSAAPSSLRHVQERWLDLLIVVLPMLEFVLTRWVDVAPLARLLRLGRAIGPEQLGPLSRVYRLRALLLKGWHAFLLLDAMARITGNTPEKRLRKVEESIADLEEQMAELHKEAEELRKKIAQKCPPVAAAGEPVVTRDAS